MSRTTRVHEPNESPYDEPEFVRPDFGRSHSYLMTFQEVIRSVQDGVIPSRPVEYKGIAFRSKLEARYSRHLEWMGDQWVYEPRIYGRKGEGYLPDFRILGGRPKFIEVKPTLAEVRAAAIKMTVIWEYEPDALLMVACHEHNQNFSALRGERWIRWAEKWTV